MKIIQTILNKIDYRLSANLFSRPRYQVKLIILRLSTLLERKTDVLVDVGGGQEPQYKGILKSLAKKYWNLEINKGRQVDIVATIYNLPLSKSTVNIITLFMVMEHLNNPIKGIKECRRVLKKDGLLALTTVQYWHTHNHPDDYFRYTKSGLEYLVNSNGFKIIDIWSIGGPYLVIFHAIELNLPDLWRTIFSILFYRVFDWMDWTVFRHQDHRENSDSVGWSLIAQKI